MARARPRVVIVGGGFGGLACARKLDGRDVDVLLVDRQSHHTFSPLLYQVATALLNPTDIAYPLRTVFRDSGNVRVRQSVVTGVDLDRKAIRTSDGAKIAADYLVLATGSETDWFGSRALAETTLPLKTLGNAIGLRNHVLACLERASQAESVEERRRFLTFVIVGGGATGVEYAGALAELLDIVLGHDHPELEPALARIVLVEYAPRLLGAFPERLGEYARGVLHRKGIDVRTGVRLDAYSGSLAKLSDGEEIATATVVWAAGVKATSPDGSTALPHTPSHRVETGDHLAVAGADRVFAIGDLAADADRGGDELAMLSPPAMQEGRHVARTILADIGGEAAGRAPGAFRYRDKGIMATIGRNAAVARTGHLQLRGVPAWTAWSTVHLYYLVGHRNKLVVLAGWSWDYLRRDRPIRVIARADRDALSEELVGVAAHDLPRSGA